MRQRAVRVVAWWVKHYPRIRRFTIRVVSLIGGLLILHREIYEVKTPEPLLVFLGLWLCGIAPAQFFDGLKKIGQEARTTLEQDSDLTPHQPRSESELKSVENSELQSREGA